MARQADPNGSTNLFERTLRPNRIPSRPLFALVPNDDIPRMSVECSNPSNRKSENVSPSPRRRVDACSLWKPIEHPHSVCPDDAFLSIVHDFLDNVPDNEGEINTTCAYGELIFNIFSALAQFERRLIQERTKAGLAAARARGRNGGHPKVTAAETKVVLAKKLHADKSLEIDDICQTLRMSRSTFYRYVRL